MKNESPGNKTPKGKPETPGNKVQTPKAKGESTEQKTPKAKEKAKQGAKTPEVKKAENKTPKKEAVTMNGVSLGDRKLTLSVSRFVLIFVCLYLSLRSESSVYLLLF